MYIINFLIAIFLPYITLFSKLAPPDTVPAYFFSEQGAFVAGEFWAVVFYWAGFLRNTVSKGAMTERRYFSLATLLLVFIIASKIIFTLPFAWITTLCAFGLGVLSTPYGQQNINPIARVLMIVTSLVLLGYSTFILIGMAWFDFSPTDYYYYRALIVNWI